MSRRFAIRLALVAALAALAAPPANAHIGEPKTAELAGPYRAVVSGIPIRSGRVVALSIRSTLTARRSGAPVDGARIRILVSSRSRLPLGPYTASGAGGAYYALVPLTDASTWRSLRFVFTIRGQLGPASFVYRPPSLFSEWLWSPLVLVGAALATGFFLQGFLRLRRRGSVNHAPWNRLVVFFIGLGALVLALVSPLDPVGDRYLLSAHMLQHMLIGDAAPALMLVALRGPLLFFFVPSAILRMLGRREPVRRLFHLLTRPVIALFAWAAIFGGWHLPLLYDYTLTHQTVHDLEHLSFIAAGLLLWNQLIDPARRYALSRRQRVGVAALVFVLGSVLSDVLIFSLRPLYATYAAQPERVFGLDALRDQQLAGFVMSLEQLLTLGTCTALLLWPTLRARSITHMPALTR